MKTFIGYGKATDYEGDDLMEESRKVFRVSKDHWCIYCDGGGCKACNQQWTSEVLTKAEIMQRIEYLAKLGDFTIKGNRIRRGGRYPHSRNIRGRVAQLRYLERETRIYEIAISVACRRTGQVQPRASQVRDDHEGQG